MRLDIDCVRDILLCVEENTGYRNRAYFSDVDTCQAMAKAGAKISSKIAPYQRKLLEQHGGDNDKIMYHLQYCADSGLIAIDGKFGMMCICVIGLTPAGHDLADNLRPKNVFEKVKSMVEESGTASVSVISAKAAELALKFLGV